MQKLFLIWQRDVFGKTLDNWSALGEERDVFLHSERAGKRSGSFVGQRLLMSIICS